MGKKLWKFLALALFAALLSSVAMADDLKKIANNIDFGIQYRVMYNSSRIGAGNQYDFFRQRLRLNFDVHTEDNVGGFLQMEFRGGWGGSSPADSDPRGAYAVNPFNRLQARGVRYGYLYFPVGKAKITAGILPLNDEVDQMIFSGDWDFNVGGVTLTGGSDKVNYRVGYVRLIEGVSFRNSEIEDEDEHFLIGDLSSDFSHGNFGVHFYGVYGNLILSDVADLTFRQTWVGPHVNLNVGSTKLRGVFLYNSGKLISNGGEDASGVLVRGEGSFALGKSDLSILAVFSSGDKGGEGFHTLQGLLGTGGYWGYSYIFSPHGPSDVNDFGFEVSNRGYGLTTVQAQISIPVSDRLSIQGMGALFRANKDMPTFNSATDKDLGTEFGVQFTETLGKNMNLQFGGAIALLGDAAKANYQGFDKDTVNEIFARLQLEF
ncbi:MAG: hypothetical protein ACE5IY_16625 [bacterium]